MNTRKIIKGSRCVIAFRNDAESPWTATLWVNNGETITNIRNSLKTDKGLEQWAAKVLA